MSELAFISTNFSSILLAVFLTSTTSAFVVELSLQICLPVALAKASTRTVMLDLVAPAIISSTLNVSAYIAALASMQANNTKLVLKMFFISFMLLFVCCFMVYKISPEYGILNHGTKVLLFFYIYVYIL